ncbi:MAG: glycosyltransferase family 1 protein [Verrucomicrobia bacterium]|nr:glycosyltransferase family 1 protein [Verrucomicrobiota bacterium]
MPHILLCRVEESQYSVLDCFSDQLKEAFVSLGCEVEWFEGEGQQGDLCISIGALPPASCAMRCLVWMVDHPFYIDPFEGDLMIGCVDRTHLSDLDKFGLFTGAALFLPHAGSVSLGQVAKERPIDLLFSGTFISPDFYREQILQLPSLLRRIALPALEAALAHDALSFEEALGREELIEAKNRPIIRFLHTLWDRAVRGIRRRQALDLLAEAGYRVHLIGRGWEGSCHEVEEPLDYAQLLERFKEAKIVLHLGVNFPAGSHERVFSAQLAGAAVISESNAYWQEVYTDGKEIRLFHWKQLKELPAIVHQLLSSDHERLTLARHGQESALASHTWEHRAAQILQQIG